MFGRPFFILSYYDFICTEIEWRDFDFNDGVSDRSVLMTAIANMK